MRITHLRQADLNLLVVFTALAEERNVTRAASRLLLSQPAVSRALQRLREMFHDDLLIRSPSGYEPTPKGKRLLQELSTMLPRLDRLLSGEDFDPRVEEATFRVAVTDHASHVLCPLICRRVLPAAAKVSIEFVPFGGPTFDAIEKGRLDLMLNADDGYLPPHFASEMIFDDSYSCVAAKESKYPGVLTLKRCRFPGGNLFIHFPGISAQDSYLYDEAVGSVLCQREGLSLALYSDTRGSP
jgi:DNA-binding transcriptional LysR family regulator